MKFQKMSMPKNMKGSFLAISGQAVANQKYRWGLNQLERYADTYKLSDNQLYMLGLLYDHLGMKMVGMMGRQIKKLSPQKKQILKQYLVQAKTFYKKILTQNPRHVHALYGIGRIYSIKGNIRTALKYQKRAYREMMKYPRKLRGAFAIGGQYEKLGDVRNAERWFLKEYRNGQRNDFGTTTNLFSFYRRHKRYQDALPLAKKLEKIMRTEFKERKYRGLHMKNSRFVKQIKWEINEVKKLARRVPS